MNKVIILPLLFELDDMKFFIYPVVLKNEHGLTMIDCGYKNFLPYIEESFVKNGLNIKDLKQIVLTHCDHDHMGAVKEITDKYPNVKVLCSKEQMPYVTGIKKSPRVIQAEQVLERLDDNERAGQLKFIEYIKSTKTVENVEIISDGEYLPMCNGVRVVGTNGHMPGHISIYIEDQKCLISGDALVLEEGELAIASKEFVLDKNEEIKSLEKLLKYDIKEIICYHGGSYTCKDMIGKLNNIIEKGYL